MAFTAGSARPGKAVGAVGSVMRYNNCGAEALEQRRVVRNPPVPTSSYPRRNPPYKTERGEDSIVEGSNGLQPKPPYVPRKVAAAQGGPSGSQWY